MVCTNDVNPNSAHMEAQIRAPSRRFIFLAKGHRDLCSLLDYQIRFSVDSPRLNHNESLLVKILVPSILETG